MASSVATPMEKQFSTIAGLESITSSSLQGATNITLQFALSRNIDAAAADVQAALAQVQRQLPPTMLPPSYRKDDPSAAPILFYAVTSPTLPLSTLDEYGETRIAQQLSTVSGVAQVQVYGSQKYAVRIELDPQALAARKIGIDEVVNAVSSGNVSLPTGMLWGTDRAYSVESNGQLARRRRVPAAGRGLSRRHAGPPRGPRPGRRQRAGHQGRRVVRRHPRHRPRHPAPARHQHRRGGPGGA